MFQNVFAVYRDFDWTFVHFRVGYVKDNTRTFLIKDDALSVDIGSAIILFCVKFYSL